MAVLVTFEPTFPGVFPLKDVTAYNETIESLKTMSNLLLISVLKENQFDKLIQTRYESRETLFTQVQFVSDKKIETLHLLRNVNDPEQARLPAVLSN